MAPPLTLTRSGLEPQLAHDGERLRGERLVQLDEVEIVDRHARARKQLADRGNRPDTHHPRIDSGNCARDEPRERTGAERLGLPRAGHDDRSRAVVQATRVPGRHAAVGPKRGLQGGELLGRRVGPRVFVMLDADDRDDLVVEPAGGERLRIALVARERKRILLFPR